MKALQSESTRFGLKINIKKNREIRIHLRINEDISRTDNFTYLGSEEIEEDSMARIKKAQQNFAFLRKVWKARALSQTTRWR